MPVLEHLDMPLDIETFGKRLVETGDLDPVYFGAEYLARRDETKARRWLLAYSCFYHVGVACYAADHFSGSDFWSILEDAALNEKPTPLGTRWPRSPERRHARGAAGVRMVRELRARYEGHEHLFMALQKETDSPVADVLRLAKTHYLFGDWIAFKLADVLERCFAERVVFNFETAFMFDSPKEGAALSIAARRGPAQEAVPIAPQDINEEARRLCLAFSDQLAPPRFERPIGFQEVETVLCKWKSHLGGRYEVGHDIDELRDSLIEWGKCSLLAQCFLGCTPARYVP